MRGSFTIARFRGIRIRLHFSFLLVLPLIAYAFSRAFVTVSEAAVRTGHVTGPIRGPPILWGAVIAIALFLSVLIHEIAHALYAQWRGAEVKDITLLMIGGVSRITEPLRDPKQEAVMALAGPVTSLLLALAFYIGNVLVGAAAPSTRFALFWLASLNLALGIFNLLPAFPMDGGRILRGLLATRMGMVRATQAAATMGKLFAFLFVLGAFVTFNFFLLFIAFFVYLGAEAESSQVLAQSVLGHVKVADLIEPLPPEIPGTASVERTADEMLRTRQLALLVRSEEGTVGVVSLDDVRRIPVHLRAETRVSDVAHVAPPISADSNVWDALRVMSDNRLPLVPVARDGQLIGVLNHDDVARGLRLHELQRGGPRARTRWTAPRERPA